MIPDKNPYNNWNGNGSTTTFDFDFYIEDETQLAVYHTNSKGVQTLLKYGTDYSINELQNENGSFINFPLASSTYSVLSENEVISLCLTLPITQENPYSKSSYLNLKTLEYSLDYLTRICQIISRQMERSVKTQEGSSQTAEELVQALNDAQVNAAASASEAANSASGANISALNSENSANLASEKASFIQEKADLISANAQAILTKATTSLDNLTDDGEAKFDGKWTITNNIIVFEGRVLSTSSTLVPFTLDFLPDNGEYEILFYSGVQLLYNNTYCYGSIGISSDIINTPFPYIRISGSASTGHVYIKDSLILPVKNKKVYISGDTQNINSKGDLIAIAYRKLGVGFETTNESEVTQDE